MANYSYISKKIRSIIRELTADPRTYFAWMESVIGHRACFNFAMVLYMELEKESGVRINWNFIRDRLKVLAREFVYLVYNPYF